MKFNHFMTGVVTEIRRLHPQGFWEYKRKGSGFGNSYPTCDITSADLHGKIIISTQRDNSVENQPTFSDCVGFYHHLSVYCVVPQDSMGNQLYWDKHLPEINVSLKKTQKQIAGDIYRRVVVPYLVHLKEMAPKLEKVNSEYARVGDMTKKLCEILGIPLPLPKESGKISLRQKGYKVVFPYTSMARVTHEDVVFEMRMTHNYARYVAMLLRKLRSASLGGNRGASVFGALLLLLDTDNN